MTSTDHGILPFQDSLTVVNLMKRCSIRQLTLALSFVSFCLLPTVTWAAMQAGASTSATQDRSGSNQAGSAAKTDKDADQKDRPLQPWEQFVPDFEDHDFDGTEDRAWEYRPYKVAVWFCLDGSPGLNAIYKTIAHDVTRRSELMDGSGWDLTTGLAPAKYRSEFLVNLEDPEMSLGFNKMKMLDDYDKFMIVCLEERNGRCQSRVREFDVQTQQWGPIAVRHYGSRHDVADGVAESVALSFMPLARIERVTEIDYQDAEGKKRRRDEVVMQARAVKSCFESVLVDARQLPDDTPAAALESTTSKAAGPTDASAQAERSQGADDTSVDDEGQNRFAWIARPSASAPAYVKPEDRFLPIIRRTDRKGNLVKLEPIEFTYLTIDSQEGAVVRASIHSSSRAPLSQRASKRARKLALVIRPPSNPTTLRLTSRDQKTRLEGFEIYSRKPGQPIDEDSEFIGKTDWRGEITIPPSEDGLRLIFVKRGVRPLKKIPLIPGLYSEVETTLPNDETRLYAEGVFKGLESEVLGLVIQRQVGEAEVAKAIKAEDAKASRAALDRLKELEQYKDLKIRVSDAANDLRFQTSDSRERKFIDNNEKILLGLLDTQITKDRMPNLMSQVQELGAKARREATSE